MCFKHFQIVSTEFITDKLTDADRDITQCTNYSVRRESPQRSTIKKIITVEAMRIRTEEERPLFVEYF
jgi:hypothetical protein